MARMTVRAGKGQTVNIFKKRKKHFPSSILFFVIFFGRLFHFFF